MEEDIKKIDKSDFMKKLNDKLMKEAGKRYIEYLDNLSKLSEKIIKEENQ